MDTNSLSDLLIIVNSLSQNHNYIQTNGMWDLTHSCILCNAYSLNSIEDIKHDRDCPSKRLDFLYNLLDDELYKNEDEENNLTS